MRKLVNHFPCAVCSVLFVLSAGCTQLTCDPQGHIPAGETNVLERGLLVGGRVVLYTDWHYLHLLRCSKDTASKYTLQVFPGSSRLERCGHCLGQRPMTWLATSAESIFKVDYRVHCLWMANGAEEALY